MDKITLERATDFINRLFEPVDCIAFSDELKQSIDISELLINNGFGFDEMQAAELLKGLGFKSEYIGGHMVWLLKRMS
jgi:hypothetical protein